MTSPNGHRDTGGDDDRHAVASWLVHMSQAIEHIAAQVHLIRHDLAEHDNRFDVIDMVLADLALHLLPDSPRHEPGGQEPPARAD